MKQLDLFTQTCSIEEIAMTGKKEPVRSLSDFHSDGNCIEVPASTKGLDQSRLAHYRAKLAKLDATGYDAVANEIAIDTIYLHNTLGKDLKIVGQARLRQMTISGYHKDNKTKLARYHEIKNNRSAK